MGAAAKSMGLKRICTGCGGRFYDFDKRPIICPSCEVEFTGEIKTKTRRGSKVAEVKKEEPVKEVLEVKEEGELVEEYHGVEVISLDDAEESSQDKTNETDDVSVVVEDTLDDVPDVGVDDAETDEADDDVTLLDEE